MPEKGGCDLLTLSATQNPPDHISPPHRFIPGLKDAPFETPFGDQNLGAANRNTGVWISASKRPLEALSVAWLRFGSCPQKLFFSSSCVQARYKRANDEDDRKILELHQQGLTHVQIAKQMPDYRYNHVKHRLKVLRTKPSPISTGERWQPHEIAIITE